MKNDLITDNMALVPPIARRYARDAVGCEYEDLVQTGYLGLCRAAHEYNPQSGVPFWAYARPWVLGEILAAVNNSPPPTEPLDEVSDEETDERLQDTIPCNEQDLADYGIRRADLRVEIDRQLSALTPREREIALRHFGEGYTQHELARMYGCSQPTIALILRKVNECRAV